MRTYFSNHQIIDYGNNQKVRNIMHSVALTKSIVGGVAVYPYTIEEGDTPTKVAFNYYGSVDYVWLVFMANGITDPYTQWYKSHSDLESYMAKKYGSVVQAMALIHHYVDTTDADMPMITPTTYANKAVGDYGYCVPVYAYDYEVALNDARMKIKLVAKGAASKLSYELEKALQ